MMISFIFGGYRLVAVFKEVRIVLCESEVGEFRGFFSAPCPQPVFPEICRCIVAKCGYFSAHNGIQIAYTGLKWPFPGIRVRLFDEKLSVGPPEEAIGG